MDEEERACREGTSRRAQRRASLRWPAYFLPTLCLPVVLCSKRLFLGSNHLFLKCNGRVRTAVNELWQPRCSARCRCFVQAFEETTARPCEAVNESTVISKPSRPTWCRERYEGGLGVRTHRCCSKLLFVAAVPIDGRYVYILTCPVLFIQHFR